MSVSRSNLQLQKPADNEGLLYSWQTSKYPIVLAGTLLGKGGGDFSWLPKRILHRPGNLVVPKLVRIGLCIVLVN